MATITREQFNKWNGQAKNGFGFDFRHYVTWSEKQLVKEIKNEDGTITRYTISYYPERERITQNNGYSWTKETGRHLPTLRIDTLHPTHTEGIYRVQHGRDITIGQPEKTKKYATLCKLSAVDIDELTKNQEGAA